MDKLDKEAHKLVAEAYELGLPVVVGVAEPSSGRTIRSVAGNMADVALVLSTLVIEISDKTGMSVNTILKGVKNVARDYRKQEERKRES